MVKLFLCFAFKKIFGQQHSAGNPIPDIHSKCIYCHRSIATETKFSNFEALNTKLQQTFNILAWQIEKLIQQAHERFHQEARPYSGISISSWRNDYRGLPARVGEAWGGKHQSNNLKIPLSTAPSTPQTEAHATIDHANAPNFSRHLLHLPQDTRPLSQWHKCLKEAGTHFSMNNTFRVHTHPPPPPSSSKQTREMTRAFNSRHNLRTKNCNNVCTPGHARASRRSTGNKLSCDRRREANNGNDRLRVRAQSAKGKNSKPATKWCPSTKKLFRCSKEGRACFRVF